MSISDYAQVFLHPEQILCMWRPGTKLRQGKDHWNNVPADHHNASLQTFPTVLSTIVSKCIQSILYSVSEQHKLP